MDISKGGAGMFLNFVPAFINAEESPFDLSVLPESLFEGQSAAITLTLKNPGSSPEKYEFSWSDNSSAPSLSPTNHSYTISDRTANLTVIPIDDDCLEDTMSIQAKRVSDSKIFTFEFRIQEVDRCIFLASNALPDMQGPGYSGNLGGIGGADLRCRNEKPPALPGEPSEYKALLAIDGVRNPTSIGTSENDWPIKIGIRYFSYSTSAPEGEWIATGVSNLIGAGSGIFSFPLNSSLNHISDTSALDFWTGLNSSFEPVSTFNCSGYTMGAPSSGFGYFGARGVVNSSAIGSYYEACEELNRIICVRM